MCLAIYPFCKYQQGQQGLNIEYPPPVGDNDLPPAQPDFHGSAPPDIARPLYSQFVETMRQTYEPSWVKDGVFGAMMQVGLVNDGPVTFDFDTAKSGNVTTQKQKDDKKKKWEEKKVAGKKVEGNQKSESEALVAMGARVDDDGNSSLAEHTENSTGVDQAQVTGCSSKHGRT